MSKRMKTALAMMGVLVASLFVGVVIRIAVHGRDIPAPDVSDLVTVKVDVPDEDNAYLYFAKAVDSFDWPRDDPRISAILTGKQWDEVFVADLLSRNASVLSLVGRGLSCPTYEPREKSKFEKPKVPFLWFPEIGRLLAFKAMYERRAGQVEQAWRTCFNEYRLGSFVVSRPRIVLDYGAGLIILSMGFDQAEQSLHRVRVQETELLALLDQLNGVASLDAGMVRTLKEEFQYACEGIDQPSHIMTRHPLVSGYAFHPNRTRLMCAEFYRAAMAMASQPYSKAHMPDFKVLPPPGIRMRLLPFRPNGVGRILASLVIPEDSIERMVTAKCSTQCRLDGLRLVVACRLYEMRHGRLPETLDSLVPEFLSSVPQDPFDGKPFRYLPEKGIVYSIGKDLKDSSAMPVSSDARGPRRGDDLVLAIRADPE